MLNLAEIIFLVSLHEKKSGSIEPSNHIGLPYALAGAMLADLVEENRAVISDGKRLEIVNTAAPDDVYMKELVEQIEDCTRLRKLTHWVDVIASKGNKLQRQILNGLVGKGILREEEKRYLWIIPFKEFTQQDASAKYWYKHHLRSIVLGGEKPDSQAVILLSLLRAADMLNYLFTADELRMARKLVDDLVGNELVGEAVRDYLDAIITATATATMSVASS